MQLKTLTTEVNLDSTSLIYVDMSTEGHVVSLDTFGDPHIAAVLLKKYLRDLPEPIFPENLYPVIRRCPSLSPDPSDISSITYIRETILPELPPCVYILLSHVLRPCIHTTHLHRC